MPYPLLSYYHLCKIQGGGDTWRGANAFLSKPFRPEQLVKKIEDTLGAHNAED